MVRQRYKNPPVHEVILDIQFQGTLEEKPLEALGRDLADRFGRASPLTTFQFEGRFTPDEPAPLRGGVAFTGWEFSATGGWLLRVHARQVTLHQVRSANWPAGHYVGWETIHERFRELHRALKESYGQLAVRRAGLRYVNRVAIPSGTDLRGLFTLVPPAPVGVTGLYTFSIHHSWAEVKDHDAFSASVRFARIAVPDGEVEPDALGVLLDFDVFNLYSANAPRWEALPEWFDEAHDVENDLFENAVTKSCRDIFNR
jgi:uncharacterized protein (TIGR04255 family)